MRIGMLIVGFLMLFNPVVQVVDLLPDCIGLFLIALAITKPAFLTARMSKARSLYIRLGYVEVVKVFSIILQARVPDTETTFPLLLVTVFGIIELLMFIPATNNFFDGLSDCANGQESSIASMTKVVNRYVTHKNDQGQSTQTLVKTKEKSLANRIKILVITFYVCRVCATILPELTELEMYEYIGVVNALRRSWASFKPHIQVLVSIIILVFGIVYIAKVSKFFRAIKKEGELNRIINQRFEVEVLPRTTLFIARRMKLVMALYALSALTSFVMVFDNVNILLGIVSASLLIVAATLLAKYCKYAYAIVPLAVVRGALSIINFIRQIRYFDEYDIEAIFWVEEASEYYYNMALLECVEFVFALLAAVAFLLIIAKVVREHISICGIHVEASQYSKKSRDDELFGTIKTKLIICIVITVINFAMAAAYRYILPDNVAIGAINSAISIVFIAYTIYAMANIDSNVYERELDIA